jgi:hypothetical protein
LPPPSCPNFFLVSRALLRTEEARPRKPSERRPSSARCRALAREKEHRQPS